jgi:hypothetical protein
MSVALYIVLERGDLDFDHHVAGKALGRAGRLLDVLAVKAGTAPLMKFFSASPKEMHEFIASHEVGSQEMAPPIPPERWFPAIDGLVTIRGLREAAKTEKIHNLEKILADLDEFERVLKAAEEQGVSWHLAVDY